MNDETLAYSIILSVAAEEDAADCCVDSDVALEMARRLVGAGFQTPRHSDLEARVAKLERWTRGEFE